VVVLAEGDPVADSVIETALVPALVEEAAVVGKHLRRDQQRTLHGLTAGGAELFNLHPPAPAVAAGRCRSRSCAGGGPAARAGRS